MFGHRDLAAASESRDVDVEQREIVAPPAGSAPTDAASTATVALRTLRQEGDVLLRLVRLAHDDPRIARAHGPDQRSEMRGRRRHAGLRLDVADEIEPEAAREIGPAVVVGDERNASATERACPPIL